MSVTAQCPTSSSPSELALTRLNALRTDFECLEATRGLEKFFGCQLIELRGALLRAVYASAESKACDSYVVHLKDWPQPRTFEISGRTFEAIVELMPSLPRYQNALSLEPFLAEKLKDLQDVRARVLKQAEVAPPSLAPSAQRV